MLKDQRKNILDFWTLCEIADFERFKLDGSGIVSYSLGGVQTKALTNEYNKNGNYTDIDYKKNDIYRLYIGIIKSDEAIKYIYKKLKSRNLIPDESLEKSARDIEQLPNFSDYTYMAYIYVDANNNLISLAGKSIVINPLFYILKNLLDKNLVNTIAYNEFTENLCKAFSNKYNITENTNAIIIPDLKYLLNKLKEPNKLKILSGIENCEVYILDQLQKEIEVTANTNGDKNQKKAQGYQAFFKEEKTKENSKFIFQQSLEKPYTYLEVAIMVAKKRFYHYVYLLTGEKYDQREIPKNLFIVDFINKNKKVTPALVYNPQKDDSVITKKKLEAIFYDCCKQLYLMDEDHKNPVNIFYKENNQSLSIFQQAFLNKTFKEIEEIEESKFLSFYINPLDENPTNLTLPYLDNITEKVDINSTMQIRKKYNSLEYFKAIKARWPANYPLNYAQQMAVNHFFSKFNQPNNIFSVNGPPGTGKTTLLKDIVAEITRRKIEHCIGLEGDIFDKNGLLKSELCGIYEIVVASNNNAAVENITKELPKLDNIDLAYIHYQQEDFLLSSFTNDFYGFNGWSLVAINLGNSTNFNTFKEKFESFKEIVKESEVLDKTFLEERKTLLIEKYNKCKNSIIAIEDTLQKLHKLDMLRAEKEQLFNEYQNLKKDIAQLQENKKNINIELNKLNGEKKSLEESINRMREILSLGENEKKEFGFFKKIFRYKAFKEVKLKISQNRKMLSVLLINIENIKKSFIEKNSLREKIEEDINNKAEHYEKVKCFYHKIVSKLDEIENIEKERTYHINNDTFYELSEEKLQKSSLYAEEEYMKEKAQLFVLSIQIQEVLFLTHFDRFSENIESYLMNYKKPLSSDDINKLRRNFSALSFVLPVVSTSLASSYQMFKNIDKYGTLLCDEAGQATPQSLVGLLNRTSNALIVGDPLQVEPVFTAPEILIDLMQGMYKIEDIHSPSKSSAQRLADEANTIGSYYGNDEDKLWVGMPLVVHRRCVEPMFSISNKVSYDEKMVLATSPIKSEDKINQLPKSCWIDVKSEEKDFNNGNTSIKEIEALESFIQKYQEILDSNYYIISPFKSIYAYKNKFCLGSLGTVHTFQGKEQDVVFVVLGGNVSRNGAKAWVSSKPNILNVATTRAKKRIYFIGDYDLWKGHKYFKIVVELLNKCTQ